MELEKGLEELVPVLSQDELKRARYNVLNADASSGKGFMMAWQNANHPNAIGFCYITRIRMPYCLVAITARSTGIGGRLGYTMSHCIARGDDENNFVEAFFKNSAEDMGGNYTELVNYLSRHSSLWRFEGFIDGKPGKSSRDNSIVWRALWGRLIEAHDRPVANLPLAVQELVQTRLRHFAIEGQIILDR